MTFLYILLALFAFGILVLVHELGHYLAARLTGIPVYELAIGFGTPLVKRVRKGITYTVRMIPFGGYVALSDPKDESSLDVYYQQSVWRRLITMLSGSLMNVVFAFVLAVGFSWAGGFVQPTTKIDTVNPGSPAQIAGLQPGDVIRMIDGKNIKDDYAAMLAIIEQAQVKNFVFEVQRSDELLTFPVAFAYDEQEQRYLAGITMAQEHVRLGFAQGIATGAQLVKETSTAVITFLARLITAGEGAGSMVSPVGAVGEMVATAKAYGVENIILMMVLISVNLGIFNLIPFPALDGSKIVFLLVEAIRKKPISPHKEGIVQMVGFAMFILLFLVLVYRDIARLIGV